MKKPAAITVIIFIFVISLPYLLGFFFEREGNDFSGLILNPVDGYTYLAKMQIGYSGEWKFTLPYTAVPGDGVYLFLFYIFLGHLSRIFYLPLILIFHGARIVSSILLGMALYRFGTHYFVQQEFQKIFMFVLMGGGLGWLVVPTGYIPADTWIAEGFPFLSSLANPHFPLGLALMLEILVQYRKKEVNPYLRFLLVLFLAFLLINILPFGFVIIGLIIFLDLVWMWIDLKYVDYNFFSSFLIGGVPVGIYQVWVSTSDPFLAVWNSQNLTPSPPLWDLLISFSPALLICLIEIFRIKHGLDLKKYRILVIWLAASIILAYIPLNLQGRFLTGYYIPAVFLASAILVDHPYSGMVGKIVKKTLIPASLITNLILLIIYGAGIVLNSPALYLSQGQKSLMTWINENTGRESVILAPPETSLMIPAMTGRRVVYGHPFETVKADETKNLVLSFYKGTMSEREFADMVYEYSILYVLINSDLERVEYPITRNNWEKVFTSRDIVLYQIGTAR